MTLNTTVKNWVMEIESSKIKFVPITGKDNVLGDTVSRLINISPNIVLEHELKVPQSGLCRQCRHM